MKCVLVFCLLIAHVSSIEKYISESNLWELDQDSFWRIVHQLDKHVVIEIYSSESWCSKFALLELSQLTYLLNLHFQLKGAKNFHRKNYTFLFSYKL